MTSFARDQEPSADFVEQVEELQVVIFNRLEPARVTLKDAGIEIDLTSSDLLTVLQTVVENLNSSGVQPG